MYWMRFLRHLEELVLLILQNWELQETLFGRVLGYFLCC